MFNKHFYWVAPVAIVCSVSSCFAVPYLSIEQAQKLCFPKATGWVASIYNLSQEPIYSIEKESGISVRFPEQKVCAAYRGKKFGAPLKLDQDIQNISGDSLSSRHITDGGKRLLSFYETILKSS